MTRIAGWKYALFDLAKTVRAVAVMAITKCRILAPACDPDHSAITSVVPSVAAPATDGPGFDGEDHEQDQRHFP